MADNPKCDLVEEQIYKVPEHYLVFIDETGDPFMHKDPERYKDPTVFPVMTVCALVVPAIAYKEAFVPAIDEIKQKFWGTREIHFHSNEIRRKDGIFKVLLDPKKYEEFKTSMIGVLEKSSVAIVSSSINKLDLLGRTIKFKERTGQEYNIGDLYLKNVEWVFERIGHFIKNDTARIIFETRGNKESRRIQGVLTEAKKNGTFYHTKDSFKNICDEILFFSKKDNVNGVQMADYCTYPFARHAKEAKDDNKLFDLLRHFVYEGNHSEYGLKEWP